MLNKTEAVSKTRDIAIVLVATGYGWAGGHFIPADMSIIAYLFQFVVIGILLLFTTAFYSRQRKQDPAANKGGWPVRALTIFTALSLIVNVANIIRGAGNTGTFGSHNGLADLVPIGILITGCILWLITALTVQMAQKKSR
jgi:hypothetical protein